MFSAPDFNLPNNDDNTVNDSLAFIEEFLSLKNNFALFAARVREQLSPEQRVELDLYNHTIATLVDILDTQTSPIKIVPNEAISKKQSLVTRLGIGGELIKMRKQGMTLTAIGKTFAIDPTTVSRFFKYYDKLKPSEQINYQRNSVFDVTERLQDLFNIINRQIARLEGTNDDIAQRYTSELRQTLALGVQITEKFNVYKKMTTEHEEFKHLVFEVLADELPHKRTQILKKITEAKLSANRANYTLEAGN